MTDESEQGSLRTRGEALRRMVRRPRPQRRAAAEVDVLREVAPRVVDRLVGLPLRLGRRSDTTVTRDDLAAAVPEGALVLRLRAEDDVAGVAWLAPDLFAALVEKRLTGTLRGQPPEPRPATPLDAVVCSELLEALCAEPGVVEGRGVRTGGKLRDPDLALELEDAPFLLLRAELMLGRDGSRGGELGVALAEPPAYDAPEAQGSGGRVDVAGCLVEVAISLPPMRFPWSQVAGLAVGDVLALPEGVIGEVLVTGIDGRVVSRGRVGRMDEMRAVRLAGEAPPRPVPELPGDAPPEPAPAEEALEALPMEQGFLADPG